MRLDPTDEIHVGDCATGVDRDVREQAAILDRFVSTWVANWKAYGRAAGPIRNGEMADYSDRLVAVRPDLSRGGTIDCMTKFWLKQKPITAIAPKGWQWSPEVGKVVTRK
jgi:hypothetical protein